MNSHIPAAELTDITTWEKSGRSGAAGHCVEAAPYAGGVVIRNSNDPAAGGLLFTAAEFVAFIGGARDGDFDHLATN